VNAAAGAGAVNPDGVADGAAGGGQRASRANPVDLEWAEIGQQAPQLAATMRRYLRQCMTFLAPNSVIVADNALRILARWLITTTTITAVCDIGREDIEEFKIHLTDRPGSRGAPSSPNTHRQRLRTLRVFFERIIEWDWPDAPARNPILNWDLPRRPEPLPGPAPTRGTAWSSSCWPAPACGPASWTT
jgi:hypothetical protein